MKNLAYVLMVGFCAVGGMLAASGGRAEAAAAYLFAFCGWVLASRASVKADRLQWMLENLRLANRKDGPDEG